VKKALFLALAIAFVLGIAGVAVAAEPTVIDPVDGASAWSYQDAYDLTAKREGGYRVFQSLITSDYASNGADYDSDAAAGWVDQSLYVAKGPHGGYDTTTNKCKTCHAVHRAEGTYYLLRSSDDACDYCHIGGGAHSAKVVYSANEGGKYTNNGHTMGSGPTIPDSSVEMAIEHVTIDRVGEEDIHVPVRVYEAEKKELFRVVGFGRHPAGHPSFGYGETAAQQANGPVFAAVGPTSLSCSNCHQTHNATALIWQPLDRAATPTGYNDSGTVRLSGGYKLLRAFPGASVPATSQHDKEMGEMLGSSVLAKVPESTLLPYAYKGLVAADKATNPAYAASFPGANSYGIALFKDEVAHESNATALDTQYVDWDGYTWQSPDWAVNSHGWHDYDFDVQRYALAVWCADCHNLNIGGRGVEEGTAELGFFKAHAERTHPVPASRGFQCYSCHRGSLDYNLALGTSSDMTGTSCTNCHFASSEYKVAQAVAGTDWPHSSGADDYKLLGNFSLSSGPSAVGYSSAATTVGNETAGVFGYKKTTVTKDNLDAVCLRCHTDIGVMN